MKIAAFILRMRLKAYCFIVKSIPCGVCACKVHIMGAGIVQGGKGKKQGGAGFLAVYGYMARRRGYSVIGGKMPAYAH